MAGTKESHVVERNIVAARKILSTVTGLLDKHSIPYHLEGGTLLGIVRDSELIPWDHDLDISVPSTHTRDVVKLKFAFLMSGYQLSVRTSKTDIGPFSKGSITIFKVKPIFDYVVKWFYPSYETIVLDIFVKVNENGYTFWKAKEKLMRVEDRFYRSHETLSYDNATLRAPNFYKEYLTQKYGDWSIPVRDWDCAKDELTIVEP
jgi:lipopolysaccharide cholinephosphotransferase